MVEDFSFIGGGKLLFGPGKIKELPSLADLKNSLLLCGNSFLKGSHSEELISAASYRFTISGEPDPDLIDHITSQVKGKIESVIAIGGGSVLDAGKAVAAMCCSDGSVEDYLEGVGTEKPNGKTLPMIAVPTTAGTGSEATKNAVICRRGAKGYKKSLRHDNYIPSLAIIDPELYLSCPAAVMGSCGMDAFCQLLESYLSTGASLYSDTLAWKGLTLFIDNFMNLFSNGKDVDSMGKIAFAAYLSGITLANAGLGTVHGIAGPLGGFFEIPHGTACGTLLPEVMRRTAYGLSKEEKNGAFQKMKQLGRYIKGKGFISDDSDDVDALLHTLDQWLEDLKIPALSHFAIKRDDVQKITSASANKNNPVQFTPEEISSIITSRL